jgi:hypothetical protein
MSYQDALERALALANDPGALDTFLETVPAWRGDLERALAVSRSLSRELSAIAPQEAARQRSQQQLMATVSRLAAAQAEAPAAPGIFSLLTLPRILIAGATAVALLALAVVVDVPSLGGGGTPTAEAVVIEGSVSAVSPDGVTISTSDSSRLVRLSGDTVLIDGFGNAVEASRLSAGQDVVLKGSRSGDDFVADHVELRDRLFGVVTEMPGDSLHLSSDRGDFVILITPQTEFEGVVAVGSFVEVKLMRTSDGALVALEVEVEDEDEDEQKGDDDDDGTSTAPAGPSVSPNTPSGSSSPTSGSQFDDGDDDDDDGEQQDGEDDGSSDDDEHEDDD